MNLQEQNNNEKRAREFLECMGNGKPVDQYDEEGDEFDYTHR